VVCLQESGVCQNTKGRESFSSLRLQNKLVLIEESHRRAELFSEGVVMGSEMGVLLAECIVFIQID